MAWRRFFSRMETSMMMADRAATPVSRRKAGSRAVTSAKVAPVTVPDVEKSIS